MRRYLSLLLFIGLVLGQNPCEDYKYKEMLDELVLKKNNLWSKSDKEYFYRLNSNCLDYNGS